MMAQRRLNLFIEQVISLPEILVSLTVYMSLLVKVVEASFDYMCLYSPLL